MNFAKGKITDKNLSSGEEVLLSRKIRSFFLSTPICVLILKLSSSTFYIHVCPLYGLYLFCVLASHDLLFESWVWGHWVDSGRPNPRQQHWEIERYLFYAQSFFKNPLILGKIILEAVEKNPLFLTQTQILFLLFCIWLILSAL